MTGDDDLDAMHAYYARGEEADRLTSAHGILEFERTKELIGRHLGPPPQVIADIGGGPGRYAIWLAESGYQVRHRDVVPRHVERLASDAADLSVETAVADARQLDLADQSVDAVLLLGPLYHIRTRHDRVQALAEAHRVLRCGGHVFAAAISRWAPRLDGVLVNRIYDRLPQALAEIDELERTGWIPPFMPDGFCGYGHRPSQLRNEVRAAGFELISLVSVEGLAIALGDLEARMNDPMDRRIVLETARATEAVPELLGIGPHLVAIGRRPRPEMLQAQH